MDLRVVVQGVEHGVVDGVRVVGRVRPARFWGIVPLLPRVEVLPVPLEYVPALEGAQSSFKLHQFSSW